MHYNVRQQQHNQITDINTLQFMCKLRNFMHNNHMQSSGAAMIVVSGSGSSLICRQISSSGWISENLIWYIPTKYQYCINFWSAVFYSIVRNAERCTG